MDDNTYDFDLAKAPQTIIKVIGVGGGGGNAVSNMYREGIRDVSFVLCNTDNQALQKSEVPNKLLIGQNTTHGLGSGNVPEVGEKAALESEEDIYRMLDDGTRMAFVTAGMGGGTGTGAGPVVAKISKDMGILTVGIVTIPFVFEGRPKIVKALRQDQVCQRQRRNNNTCHIELDLLRHVRGYGMTKRRTANEQLIVGFNTRTPQTYRMGFRLVVEIINGSGYIQHVQHIGTILPAFLVQFLQHLFSHRTATEHFRHGMVDRTERLASHPDIHLADAGTAQLVFQFADQPHDLAGCIFYIIYTSSSYTGIGVLHFVGNDGKCPGRAFRAYHADHVRRAKVDGRYKVCVCHILYLLVQTI